MTKTTRRILLIIGGIILCCFIAVGIANHIVKNKLVAFLENDLPPHISQSHKEVSLHLLDGSITIQQLDLAIRNKDSALVYSNLAIESVRISDFSYWDYFVKDQMHFASVTLSGPTIRYYKHKKLEAQDTTTTASPSLNTILRVDRLTINNAMVHTYDNTSDSTAMSATNLRLILKDIYLDANTIQRKNPINFSGYTLEGDSLFTKISRYENLYTRTFSINDGNAVFNNIALKTKYSRAEHSRLLATELDHVNLTVDNVTATGFDIGFNNEQPYLKSSLLTIDDSNLDIYRNKLVADDPKRKPLYSEQLRKLPIALSIDTIRLENAYIKYSEKVHAENPPGSIHFDNTYATFYKVGNTYGKTNTQIDIRTKFMSTSLLKANWEFNVENPSDRFTFRGDLASIASAQLNSFTVPNLRLKLEGEIQQTYFTINGDGTSSNVDMEMKYDEFKIKLIKKNGREEKDLLSAIANLFIKKNSNDDGKLFRKGEGTVTRAQNKSFFNYLWLNVETGMKSALTGPGVERKQ
ncbi:AsmA family protein [Constantimarinum furrinae]|nr:hypothetical protein [Constantimarinum furrinae]